MYTLSPVDQKRIKNREGLRLRAYICAAGKWTIGYGHRLYGTSIATITCSQAQADQWFDEDIQRVLAELWLEIKTLTPNELGALVSFIFNIGINAWRNCAARKDLLKGDTQDVPHEIRRWVHDDHGNVIPGLVPRRNDEAAEFEGALAA